MRKMTLLLTFACCLATGCGGFLYGPVKEVQALIDEKDAVLSQIDKKVEANPSEAGVDEARRIFESRKNGLKAKRDAIDKANQGLNNDWQALWMKSNAHDRETLTAISGKLSVGCKAPCESAEEKFRALERDFLVTVGAQ